MFTQQGSSRTRKIFSTAIAATVAVTLFGAAFAPDANAGTRAQWIAGGIAAGIIGTAIIANESRRHRGHHRARHSSRWERHVIRCENRYQSYDEGTDTWIDRRGRERRCRL